MKLAKFALPAIAAGFACSSALGGISVEIVDQTVVPGVVTHAIMWDGGGTQDWTSAAMVIDLTSGSAYQTDGAGADGPPSSFVIGLVPAVEFDTYVGIIDDGSAGIAGGAGDLGGGPLSMNAPQISVSWYNNSTDDTGIVKIGNVSLSTDAQGTWSILSAGVTVSGIVGDGYMVIPEPASLGLLGIGGLALIRRR